MDLFNLTAKLGLDKKDYDEGLKGAEKNASSFGSKLGTVAKGIGKAFTATTKVLGIASGAAIAFGKKMIDLGGEIDDNAQRLGMSTDQYQLWSFAMTKAGTDVSTLQRGMIQLSNWTNELSAGQADALKTLDDLGIGYEEFMAMDNAQQLEAVTNALQGMSDQTEKANLAQELFGDRVAQQMMPLFNEEQGSIAKLNETLKEQGVIVREDNIKAAADLGDKIDLLKATFTNFGLKLATDVFPEIGQLIDGFQQLATGSEEATNTIGTALVGVVDKVVAILPDLIDGVVNLLFNVIDGILPKVPEITQKLLQVVTDILNKLTEYLPSFINVLVDAVLGLIDAVITELPNILTSLVNAAIQIVTTLLSEQNIGKIIDAANSLLVSVFENLLPQIPTLVLNLQASLFTAIENIFSQKNLKKMGNLAINLGIALVNGIIMGLNNLANVKIKGLKIGRWQVWDDINVQLFSIPTIPFKKFANGGMFDKLTNLAKGTMFAVAGESGAEIVAHGSKGTGVANVEQIADAQYMAMKDYGLNETIRESASAIVNGIVGGTAMNRGSDKATIVVQIGEKDFKSYIVKTINETLNAKGRKNLNAITAY